MTTLIGKWQQHSIRTWYNKFYNKKISLHIYIHNKPAIYIEKWFYMFTFITKLRKDLDMCNGYIREKIYEILKVNIFGILNMIDALQKRGPWDEKTTTFSRSTEGIVYHYLLRVSGGFTISSQWDQQSVLSGVLGLGCWLLSCCTVVGHQRVTMSSYCWGTLRILKQKLSCRHVCM